MADISVMNIGGTSYNVKDSTSRTNSSNAQNLAAYREDGDTASQAFSIVGTPINWKGTLYYTKTAVAKGATWVVGTNLTAATNLGKLMRNIKTYVGGDGKLHFTDLTGADTALNFSSGGDGEPFVYRAYAGTAGQGSTVSVSLSSFKNGEKICIVACSAGQNYTVNTPGITVACQCTGYSNGGYYDKWIFGTVTDNTKSVSITNQAGYNYGIRLFKTTLSPSAIVSKHSVYAGSGGSGGSNWNMPLSSCNNGDIILLSYASSGIALLDTNEAIEILGVALSIPGNNAGLPDCLYLAKIKDNTKVATTMNAPENYVYGAEILKLTI